VDKVAVSILILIAVRVCCWGVRQIVPMMTIWLPQMSFRLVSGGVRAARVFFATRVGAIESGFLDPT